jgi:hypothetical protein
VFRHFSTQENSLIRTRTDMKKFTFPVSFWPEQIGFNIKETVLSVPVRRRMFLSGKTSLKKDIAIKKKS